MLLSFNYSYRLLLILWIIWLHVFLYNTNNFQEDRTLTNTTKQSLREPESNGIKDEHQNTQSSRTGMSA